MHTLTRGLRVAAFTLAVLPLAIAGNFAIGAVEQPQSPRSPQRASNRVSPSGGLERAIEALRSNDDPDRSDDLRDDLDEEFDDLEDDLDDIEADLDEADADLDPLRDVAAKRRAEEKLRELEDKLSDLNRQLRDLRSSPSVSGARRIGAAIVALRAEVRELRDLVNEAEDRGEEDLDDEDQLRQDIKEEEDRLKQEEKRREDQAEDRADRERDREKRRIKRERDRR